MKQSERRRIVAAGIWVGLVAGAMSGQPQAAEAPAAAGWRSLFDGERLGDWKVTAFGGEGEGWLRWCFASRDVSRLEEGVARLRRWLGA